MDSEHLLVVLGNIVGKIKLTDGNTLGVNGAQVGILEERDKVSLNGLLKSTDGRRLKAKIRFEILGDFTNQALEGKLADQELRRLLVTTDFTKSNSSFQPRVSVLLRSLTKESAYLAYNDGAS